MRASPAPRAGLSGWRAPLPGCPPPGRGGLGPRLACEPPTAMRVLLLHPEDSPLQGPWATQQWDLIVDLGKSSPGTAAYWEQRTRSRVLRSEMFRRGLEDIRVVREMLFHGRVLMMDEPCPAWWELTM